MLATASASSNVAISASFLFCSSLFQYLLCVVGDLFTRISAQKGVLFPEQQVWINRTINIYYNNIFFVSVGAEFVLL